MLLGLPGLRPIRRALKLTAEELARQIGSHENVIYGLETGKSDCSQAFMRQLAAALWCRVADLHDTQLTPDRLAAIKVGWHLNQAKQATA